MSEYTAKLLTTTSSVLELAVSGIHMLDAEQQAHENTKLILAQREAELKQLHAAHASAVSRLDTIANQYTQMKDTLADNDSTISDLKAELDKLKSACAELVNKIPQDIPNLKDNLEALREYLPPVLDFQKSQAISLDAKALIEASAPKVSAK